MSARAAPRAGSGRKPAVRVRPPARTGRRGVGKRIATLWAALPIPRAFLRALRTWALALLLVAGILAGLVAMGVPQAIGLALAHAAGRAGLTVRTIQIEGREHVDRDAIYRAVMDARGQDMPLVDLEALRRNLMGLAWVQDARVSRRLPDTLVIDIVERAPVAIWQYQQRLALIDKTGEVIAPLDPAHLPDRLPLVIGREANRHAADLDALIATQPVLKPLIQDGAWVGDRRWDIHFATGETLSLPEGEAAARAAFATFARTDSESHLLGHGIDRFDMRDPARTIVRVTKEPGLRLDKMEPATDPAAGSAIGPAAAPADARETKPASRPATPAADAAPRAQIIAQQKIL